MIRQILPILIAGAALAQVSFVGGLSSDATGGPASGGQFCGTTTCHGGSPGDFDPSLKVYLLEESDTIAEYVPGTTYRLRVEINAANGTPTGYGFQAVALQADTIAGAGSFSEPGQDVRLFVTNGRPYATHSTRSATNFFEVDWTAPESGFGDVEFWVAGNAVNGNGSNSGDNAVRTEDPVVLPESKSTRVQEITAITSFSVFPNPAFNQPVQLRLQTEKRERLNIRLLSSDGRIVSEDRWEVQSGENNRLLDLGSLPAGLYSVQLFNGTGTLSKQILKH